MCDLQILSIISDHMYLNNEIMLSNLNYITEWKWLATYTPYLHLFMNFESKNDSIKNIVATVIKECFTEHRNGVKQGHSKGKP